MIHIRLRGKVTHEPQRRSGRDGEPYLRLRVVAKSAGYGVRSIVELRGADLDRTVAVGDVIEVEGQALLPVYVGDTAQPFSALVMRALRVVAITPPDEARALHKQCRSSET